MKIRNLLSGIALIVLSFTSCKDEKETMAKKSVDTYVVYVDSIAKTDEADVNGNWQAIDAGYQLRSTEADAALANIKENQADQDRINASKAKYDELKMKYDALKAKEEAEKAGDQKIIVIANPKQVLRDAYFGAGRIGEDMSFSWVNKDNILSVYTDFYNKFNDNKKSYSREDLDEIKALYEALDSRKNTVEKEGLTSKDNLKIAEIKLKFAPKLKWNRMGAKSEENADAKK